MPVRRAKVGFLWENTAAFKEYLGSWEVFFGMLLGSLGKWWRISKHRCAGSSECCTIAFRLYDFARLPDPSLFFEKFHQVVDRAIAHSQHGFLRVATDVGRTDQVFDAQ